MIAPQHTINQGLTGRIERGMVAKKPMVRSGRDHITAHVLDVYNTIPFNPERTDACVIQLFTAH
jgi:hypothetical protein